jgi:hypothetical protein
MESGVSCRTLPDRQHRDHELSTEKQVEVRAAGTGPAAPLDTRLRAADAAERF